MGRHHASSGNGLLGAAGLATAILLALPGPALAEGGDAGRVTAAPLHGRLRIDGRLDEPGWAAAQPFSDLVQLFPVEAAAPSERTEVRVLHDERTLYVGIRCYDSQPEAIIHSLGRRDAPPSSDSVQVYVDSAHGHRGALLFLLTAGGVQADALVYDDDRVTYEWDAAWEGAAALLPDGWSAELAIPLSVLGIRGRSPGGWGFAVQREIARTHEKVATVLFPRGARGLASRLGHLGGIEDIDPRLDVEVAPYLASRLVARPKHSDPLRPRPRLLEPSADLGADFRAGLGAGLALTGTLNPDFGQVEADQIILNLSNFEYYFPEKRPFFTQGLDLFRSVGDGNELPPQQLFYSRRIGVDTPIFGAVKLTGSASERIQIGLLDAVVAGAGQRPGASEDSPDGALRWSPAQPLRFAPGLAYPFEQPAARNFLAAVARAAVTDRIQLGLAATSVLPLTGECTASDLLGPGPVPARCQVAGGHALALDATATSGDSDWYAYGQLAASRSAGGPPVRLLPDGTSIAPGDAGLGSYLRFGRRGGEPWRFELAYTYASPRFDLNAAGFLYAQNYQEGQVTLRYARPSGGGPFHDYAWALVAWADATAAGLETFRGLELDFDALLKPFYLGVHCYLRYSPPFLDVREAKRGHGLSEGAGVPVQRSGWIWSNCAFESDPARAASISGDGWIGRNVAASPLSEPVFYGAEAKLKWRPHPRVETSFGASLDHTAYAVRYVDGDGAAVPFLFAQVAAPTLSFNLRQLVVLAPHLTVQLYGQLFSALVRYGPFYAAKQPGSAPVRIADLQPAAGSNQYDFHETNLVLNAVLAWEYRPGSTLFVVYGRNQSELPMTGGDPAGAGLGPRALARGPTVDSLLVKWSYLFRN